MIVSAPAWCTVWKGKAKMVQVRVHQPVNTDGSINLEAWLDHVVSVDSALDRVALKEACEFAQEVEKKGNPAKHS